MRTQSLMFVLVAVTGFAAGCGGGGSGGDSPSVDAKVFLDAPPSTALTGLGQACMSGANTCPANAPLCILFTATSGYCTSRCITDGTFMTNNANPVGIATITPNPTTQNGMCTPIYTGTIGTAACNIPFNIRPNEALVANKNYQVDWACGIGCGMNGPCPTGMVCDAGICSTM